MRPNSVDSSTLSYASFELMASRDFEITYWKPIQTKINNLKFFEIVTEFKQKYIYNVSYLDHYLWHLIFKARECFRGGRMSHIMALVSFPKHY